MRTRSKMRPDQCRLRTEYLGIYKIQHFTAPVIIGIAGRTGKVKIAHLLPLERLNNLPLIMIDYPVKRLHRTFDFLLCGLCRL
ncbi:hypothetical protein D3C73_1424300 [compost metagenome]